MKEELIRFQSDQDCPACNGKRLKMEALSIKIDNKDISEITNLSIIRSQKWFENLKNKLNKTHLKISNQILKEINDRIGFLNSVGLGYLNLSRKSGTLSGGESQRIRLASQIGSGLTGVLYVLDEPSIGLHQRDNEKLLKTLKKLRDLGNTVIVVEHDLEAMLSADYMLDIGPGAGIDGGYIIAEGTPKEIMNNKKSITGNYLSGLKEIPTPKKEDYIILPKFLALLVQLEIIFRI